jgi:peptide/nickel transport system substrate-binding protein
MQSPEFFRKGVAGAALIALAAGGCSLPTQAEPPFTPEPGATQSSGVPSPTTLPPPPKTLVVCLGREPESLYLYSTLRLYGEANREADAILQAIYDGPYDLRSFEVQPVILEQAPSLAAGSARLEPRDVGGGETYLNPETLLPETLRSGKLYLPSGCTSLSCARTYQGGTVAMDAMVVDFRLREGLLWSDGEPLTADDSVFSYELNAGPESGAGTYLLDRTYDYSAVDERTARWTGIPGFFDAEYATNFWSPLPRHQLGALSPDDLEASEEANLRPLGWGPFQIEEWREGDAIVLRRNPNYFRTSEGLPYFEELVFRFVGAEPGVGVQQLLNGECDVLDETAIAEGDLVEVIDLEAAGTIRIAAVAGPLVDRIDLNLRPVGASPGGGLFADGRMRQAIAACIDRDGLVDEVLFGLGAPALSYLPPLHPLYAADLSLPAHDPAAAGALLDQLGWLDDDGSPETPRTAHGAAGAAPGATLAIHLRTGVDALHTRLAAALEEDLAACGIDLVTESLEPASLLAGWPDGPVFGRTFEAVAWAWLGLISPQCEMFSGREIASDENPYGINALGFRNTEYDSACDASQLALPGSDAQRAAIRRTQEILAGELATLPLFARPRYLAYSTAICGVEVDPSVFSLLWGVETWDTGERCAGAPAGG